MSSNRSFKKALENTISDITKGIGCFEAIPGRRYGVMRTSKRSWGWDVHDIRLVKGIHTVRTWDTHSKFLDTYIYYAAIGIDVLRIAGAVYKDEGVGANVAKTCCSIGGGWTGGYFGARAGQTAGEFIGQAFGGNAEAYGCVIGGYLGGIFGAHYGEKIVQAVLPSGEND